MKTKFTMPISFLSRFTDELPEPTKVLKSVQNTDDEK
jgi:hypothetical protein